MGADVLDPAPLAARLPQAWRSQLLGRVGEARLRLLRMDPAPFAEETHEHTEALPVLDGELRPRIAGEARTVRAGELCLVLPGVGHAVEAGSAGTLLIVDA